MSFLKNFETDKFENDLLRLELLRDKAYRFIDNPPMFNRHKKRDEAINLLQYYKDERRRILVHAVERGFDINLLLKSVQLLKK